ncbi:S-protein homolog 3-like [Juglans regia]|nr:S-protein homolog 3-like [Juglans regia]
MAVSKSEAGFLQHKARVRISNDLGEGMDLSVHCISGDDDLGTHLIPYHSGYYEFGFRPNFQGTTLFHCGFQWNDVFHHFDIYNAVRDQLLCNLCLWNIKADRPCMFNKETSKYDLCYDWSP